MLDLASMKKSPPPLCVGAKALYEGKRFYVARLWKHVSCKHCLNKKENKS